MDTANLHADQRSALTPQLPAWAIPRGRIASDIEAAFSGGIALKALDDIVRSQPVWAGCWRSRQALKCAASTVRFMGRGEDEGALRDAVLLTSSGDDHGPSGKVLLAFRNLGRRRTVLSHKAVAELAALFGLVADSQIISAVEHAHTAIGSGRAAPFIAADLVSSICSARPEAEPFALALADLLIATILKWPCPLPLLAGERHGAAFRGQEGRGRVRPGEDLFARAICLALVDGANAAIRSASEIARRSEALLTVAAKVRTKGADVVIGSLLDDDSVLGSAPGSGLSRWASTRLFERLQGFGVVRELSGRNSFRIYGV